MWNRDRINNQPLDGLQFADDFLGVSLRGIIHHPTNSEVGVLANSRNSSCTFMRACWGVEVVAL